MKITCCVVIAALALATFTPAVPAAEPRALPSIKVTEYSGFSVAKVLEENVGRQVEVTLASGATFKGQLAAVGAQAIHLSELSGREFFDAAIDRSAIVAVVLRVRER